MKPLEADLHPDLAALLADPRLTLTRPPAGATLEQFRQAANGYLKRASGPALASVEDIVAEGPGGPLTLRFYRAAPAQGGSVVLFLHGGGFVFGNLETHDGLCRALALRSGMTIVAVDYRLAPEHPYPAALEDALAALSCVRSRLGPHTAAIVGDSAGGQIATATALIASQRDEPVQGLGLMYPCVDPGQTSASHADFGKGRMLTADFLDWAWDAYQGGHDRRADPSFDLGQADLSGLPSTVLVTAGHDPLKDEGLVLGRRIRQAGVDLSSRHYPDMIHGFLGLPRGTARTEEALTFMTQGLKEALRSR